MIERHISIFQTKNYDYECDLVTPLCTGASNKLCHAAKTVCIKTQNKTVNNIWRHLSEGDRSSGRGGGGGGATLAGVRRNAA